MLRKIAAINSLNLSFGQELKSSYSNKSFLLLNKNQTNKQTNKKLPKIQDHINSFQVYLPHHLKTSVFDIFRWLESVPEMIRP